MELPPGDQLLIPSEAFSFWPSGESVCSGSGKHILRFIFYRTQFSEFELSAIAGLKQLIGGRELPPFYSDEELLRLLIANGFDKKKTLQGLNNSITWRETNLPDGYLSFYNQSIHLLDRGGIYIQGLDHKFRPLLVLNLVRMNLKNTPVAEYSSLLCFLLEFSIKHLMLPGQVENWIVITDLGKYPLLKLPISDLKKLIQVLQDNYKCRMVVNYVLNAPASISFAWGIAKKLLDQQTVRKIKILKHGQPKEIFKHFARQQVEEQYGGSAPNRTNFWPLSFPPGPYHAEGEEPHVRLPSDTDFSIGSILDEEAPNCLPANEICRQREDREEALESVSDVFDDSVSWGNEKKVSHEEKNEERRHSFIDKISRLIRNSIDEEHSREALRKAEEEHPVRIEKQCIDEEPREKKSCFRRLFCLCKTNKS